MSLAAFAVSGCSPSRSAIQKQLEPSGPPAVTVTKTVASTVPVYAEVVGQTAAVTTIDLTSQVEGTLERVAFKEGAEVRQGQVLFVIDQRPYQAALLQAQAQLATARANLVQARQQRQLLQARTNLATAVASLQQARQQVQLRQAQAQLAGDQAQLALARKTATRDRALLAQGAIPQEQLDTDQTTELTAAATVSAQEAVVRNTALAQQVQIEQAAAGVVSAKAQVHDAALATRIGIETAGAAVQQAEAGVLQARTNLSYTVIRAPIDGVIGVLKVDQGNVVAKNQVIDSMASVNPMEAQFHVSELGYLRLAKEVAAEAAKAGRPPALLPVFQLVLADNSVYPHPGTFKTLNRALDTQTGTILVEALFPNPERLLRPGMYVRVRAKLEDRPDTVLVPQASVSDLQGSKVVFVVGPDNKVALRTIAIGDPYGPAFTVLSGLRAGERVIVQGIQKVRPGIVVAPAAEPFPALPPRQGAVPAPDRAATKP